MGKKRNFGSLTGNGSGLNDEGQSSSKKQKKAHDSSKLAPEATSKALPVTKPSSVQRQDATTLEQKPFDLTSHNGLSKTQKRKLKKLLLNNKLDAAKNYLANAIGQQKPVPQSAPVPTSSPSPKRKARRAKSNVLDRDLIRDATNTKLLIPPKKHWTVREEHRNSQPRDHELLRRVTSTTLLQPPKKQWVDGRETATITASFDGSKWQAANTDTQAASANDIESPPGRLPSETTGSPPLGSDTAMIMHSIQSAQTERHRQSTTQHRRVQSKSPTAAQTLAAGEDSDNDNIHPVSDGAHSTSDDDVGDDADLDAKEESPTVPSHGSDDAPAPAKDTVESDSDGEASSALISDGVVGHQHAHQSPTAQAQGQRSVNADDGVETAPVTDRSPLTHAVSAAPDRDDHRSKSDVLASTIQQKSRAVATDSATKDRPKSVVQPTPRFYGHGVGPAIQHYDSINHRLHLAPLVQHKANSTITHSGEDVRETFKRFSAMVRTARGKHGDSSDDDDDDDDSENDSDTIPYGAGKGETRRPQDGVPHSVAGSLVQTEHRMQASIEPVKGAETESESQWHGVVAQGQPRVMSWSAINNIRPQQQSVPRSETRVTVPESDASDELSDEEEERDDDEALSLRVLDRSGGAPPEPTAREEIDESSSDEDASVSDSDHESMAGASLEITPTKSGEKEQTTQARTEVGDSQEVDDEGASSDENDAVSTKQLDNGASKASGAARDGAHSSPQSHGVPKELIEISSDSESSSFSDDDADTAHEFVDSPLQSAETTIPPHAAQLQSELAAASQTSMPAPRQTRAEKRKKAFAFDPPKDRVGVDEAPTGGATEIAHSLARPAVSNEDEDLYRTIDEVSAHVFASTRPLPPCKPDQSSTDETDARLTESRHLEIEPARRHRRVAIEVSIPKAPRLPEEDVIICYSTGVPEFEHGFVHETHGLPAVIGGIDDGTNTQRPVNDDGAVPPVERIPSSSSLSELTHTPSPPPQLSSKRRDKWLELLEDDEAEYAPPAELRKKRKMTGMTSKHFSPAKRATRRSSLKETVLEISPELQTSIMTEEARAASDNVAEGTPSAVHTPSPAKRSAKPKRKSTGTKSEHFLPFHLLDRVDLPTPTKGGRVPAGVSRAPVPPISSERFGIIQEKLWDQPFWLLVAVTFLNKTTGRAAVPTFWALKEAYPTPEALANANQETIHDMIRHLGLQTQRSKRLIKMAEAWLANPPIAGKRYKTTNYPLHGDHKDYNRVKVIEEDAVDCKGALEIGHIPGCGAYAWDSWRMFCRDVLREVAQDYNGKGAQEKDFQPEWQKVLADDKELRATLRWMWLREGWIWNHETGEKRRATEEEMDRAAKGQMDVADAGEMKFAVQAAGVETPKDAAVPVTSAGESEGEVESTPGEVKEGNAETAEVQQSEGASEEIAVSSKPKRKATRRSSRRQTIA